MRGLRYCSGLLLLALWRAPLAAQEPPGSTKQPRRSSAEIVKERVTGIGGFFFRARHPKALSEWYLTYLGVNITPSSYEESPWQQEAGPTVFAPFPQNTDYFGSAERDWGINFRVRNLKRLMERSQGVPQWAVRSHSRPRGESDIALGASDAGRRPLGQCSRAK